MSALQRLIAGFGFGCLLTLLVFPASRALLLHPLHTNSIEATLAEFPLSGEPSTIKEPADFSKLTPLECLMIAVRISDILNFRKTEQLPEDQAEVAIRFFNHCRETDKDNAAWPQLLAAVKLRAGRRDEALDDWRLASASARWTFEGFRIIRGLWDKFAADEGRKYAWQGLLALKQRRTAVQIAVSHAAEEFLNTDSIEARVLCLKNFDLMREGSNGLEGARRASEGSLKASGLAPLSATQSSPADREQQYIEFESKVRNSLGPDASVQVLTLMRRNDAWLGLMQPEQTIRATTSGLTLYALIATTLPSALFWSGVLLSLLALLGTALAAPLQRVPHPSRMGVFAMGALAAGFSLYCGTVWMAAVWYLFIGVLLSWPVEFAEPTPVRWNLSFRSLQLLLAVATVILLGSWIVSISPSAIISIDASQNIGRMLSRPQTWLELSAWVFSLAIPFAAVWARLKRKSPLSFSVEAMTRVAASGAVIALVTSILSTPICMLWDKSLQTSVDLKILNEPAFHRILKS